MLDRAIFVYEQTHLRKIFLHLSWMVCEEILQRCELSTSPYLSLRPFTFYCLSTAELVFMKRFIRYCRNVKNLWLKLDKSGWQNCESFW
jgi:hypothetical protein